MKGEYWTTKEQEYVEDLYKKGFTMKEIVYYHNTHGWPVRTYDAIKGFMYKSRQPKRQSVKNCRYTKAMDQWLIDHSHIERGKLTRMFNKKFKQDVPRRQIAARLSKRGYFWIERCNPVAPVKAIKGVKYEE